MENKVKLLEYTDTFKIQNRLRRVIWQLIYLLGFRPFVLNFFNSWRIFILRLFGADISYTTLIYSNCKIWAPWNLKISTHSVIGPYVDIYNQGIIIIGSNTVISQKTYLCASSHDITNSKIPLILKPIEIKDQVWVAADAFIGPGVTIGQGAVVGARAAVFKDVEPWTVVGGNPAKFIKKREILK